MSYSPPTTPTPTSGPRSNHTPDAGTFQRFRSSLAFLAPHFDSVAGKVLDRVSHEFPSAQCGAFKTRRGRYELASDFALVVKHAENPVTVLGLLRRFGRWLEDAGMTERDVSRLRAMIVEEARNAAGRTWSDELESDWNAVVKSVLSNVPMAAAPAVRAAA
jgi:hypothetical protein